MTEDRKTVRTCVTGAVQGIGFRYWTREEAEKLGLTGFVRNEPDGSVTAVIAGPEAAVSAMIERLRHGPPGASVSAVEAQEEALAETSGEFLILR